MKKVFFVPLLFREVSTDVQEQTIHQLSKKGLVVRLDLVREPLTGRSIWKQLLEGKVEDKIVYKQGNVVYCHRFYILPLIRYSIVRKFNNFLFDLFWLPSLSVYFFLRLKINGFSKFYFWVFYPEAQPIVSYFSYFCKVIFDCNDYFSSHLEAENEQYFHLEKKLAKQASLITVTSEVLLNKFSSFANKTKKVPLGFRLSDFKRLNNYENNFNDRKIVGYIGAINYRIDYLLLAKIILNNPDLDFELWGPKILDSERETELFSKQKFELVTKLPNVSVHCAKDKKEMPSIISRFDICIIPYTEKLTFNRNCFPLKIFEYFYAGKPVISTYINELTRYSDLVKIGSSYEEWQEHLKLLTNSEWSVTQKVLQKKLAIQNSWKNKISYICDILDTI